jgi:hypothetical protein
MKNKKDQLKPIITIVIVFILISILINITSQIYFSPQRVQAFLDKTLSTKEDIKIDFSKAQISFSGSLTPFFAIKISDVKLFHQSCVESYELNAPYLLIPFSIFKAFNKKLSLGYIKAGEINLTVKDSAGLCPDSPTVEKPLISKINDIDSEKSFEVVFAKIKTVFKNLRGFRIVKFKYHEIKVEKESSILINNIRISYNKKDKSIYTYNEFEFQPASFNLPGALPKNSLNIKIKSTLSYDNGFSFQANARHLEGVFEISSKPQKTINDYDVEVKVKDLPLSFLGFFKDINFLNFINAHRVWYNSVAVINLKNFFSPQDSQVFLRFNNLEIYGPVLKAFASNFKVQAYPEPKIIKDIQWRLDSLNLNGLVSSEKLSKLRGVVDEFGVLKGSGKILTTGELFFEGLLKDSSFIFSMNGKKALQKLKQANLNINYSYPTLNLELDNILLQGGSFEGDIKGRLTWAEDFNWSFSVNSETLSLSEKIQSLYSIEQSPFESLKLTVVGKDRELISLKLNSKLAMLKTKWGEFLDSIYELNYIPEFRSYRFDLFSKLFVLNSHFLKIDLFDSYKKLQNFSTRLELSGRDKSFSLITKTLKPPFLNITAEGEDYNKEFIASLKMDKTNFVLQGHINSGFKIKSVE